MSEIRKALESAREALKLLADMTGGRSDDEYVWGVQAEVDAALSAVGQKDGTVGVKPLEWFDPSHGRDTLRRAETPFGIYRVYTHHEANGRWFWSLDGYEKQSGEVNNEAEGFAAAQAHHDALVRSALTPSPVDTDGVEGLEPVAWKRVEKLGPYDTKGREAVTLDPIHADLWRGNKWTASVTPLYSATTLAALKAELDEARADCDRFIEGKVLAEHQRKAAESRLAAVVETRAEIIEECAKVISNAAERLPGIETPIMGGDNLAICLCSLFDDGDKETEDDTGWSQRARDGYEEVTTAIREHFNDALRNLKDKP